MRSLQTLLHNVVDYAGLFPPAGLPMASAVANYAAYRIREDAWALGRYIVPVSRLEEFELAAADVLPCDPDAESWRLSVLAGADLQAACAKIAAFNERYAAANSMGSAVIDAIELKATSAEEIYAARCAIPAYLVPYVEIPILSHPGDLVAALAQQSMRAKVRTGGVTPEMFPAPADLLRFIRTCIDMHVPFKATAGLHHPVRSAYPLTYEPGSPSAVMYGFLNVLLAAAFLAAGMNPAGAARILEEPSVAAFRFDDQRVVWRDYQVEHAALVRARRDVVVSFGSCSFREPINELKALNLL